MFSSMGGLEGVIKSVTAKAKAVYYNVSDLELKVLEVGRGGTAAGRDPHEFVNTIITATIARAGHQRGAMGTARLAHGRSVFASATAAQTM